MGQALLFGREQVGIDTLFRSLRRSELGNGAWIAHQPSWLSGHLEVFESLRDGLSWRAQKRRMYEREVDVPRLVARWRGEGNPGHTVVGACVRALSRQFQRDLSAVSLAYYRDGADSVAPHGDRMGSLVRDCVIAIVAVGDRRRFLLKPVSGGESLVFDLGWGDLLVMGGTCQQTYVHGIPKSKRPVGPRISIQFRQASPDPERASSSRRPQRANGATRIPTEKVTAFPPKVSS